MLISCQIKQNQGRLVAAFLYTEFDKNCQKSFQPVSVSKLLGASYQPYEHHTGFKSRLSYLPNLFLSLSDTPRLTAGKAISVPRIHMYLLAYFQVCRFTAAAVENKWCCNFTLLYQGMIFVSLVRYRVWTCISWPGRDLIPPQLLGWLGRG